MSIIIMWEYFIHDSHLHSLSSILNDKQLETNEPAEDGIKGVYMHLLFDTLKYTNKYWRYNALALSKDHIIYGFDTYILKHFPFKICPDMYYGKNCKDVLLEGNGNLTRKPSLLKVKHHINKEITSHYYSYIKSHEVIILKNIPLSLCKFIIIHKENKYKKDIDTLIQPYPHIHIIYTTLDNHYKELLNSN